MLPGVQHPGGQRDQGDEADVGEHPARHHDGAVEFGQARGHQPDDRRRRKHAGDAGDEQGPEQHRGDRVDEAVRHLVALAGAGFPEDGDEGLGEGALGEQPAQHVGDAERSLEGVGPGAGTEHRGHHQLAAEAGDARGQGQQGNDGGGAQQVHGRGDYRERLLTPAGQVCQARRGNAILVVFAKPG